MTFLTNCVLIVSIALSYVHGRESQLNDYLILQNPSWNGDSLKMKVNRDFLLSNFYNNVAVATKVIHADSIRINGVCNEIDIHVVRNEFKVCALKFPQSPENKKRCIWNKSNVIKSAEIDTIGAYSGDTVQVQLYDKKNCQKLIQSGILSVAKKSDTPVPSISDCIRITAIRNSEGERILFDMNTRKVLQQHYEGGNQQCGRFVFVTSVSVNGVCASFNAHVFEPKDFENCRHLKGTQFKKCFWTPKLMTKSMLLDSVSAFKGNEVEVKTFRKSSCEDELDSGILTVR